MSQDTTLHLDLAIPLPEGDSIQVLPGVSFWKRKRYRLSYRGWAVGIVDIQSHNLPKVNLRPLSLESQPQPDKK